MAPPRRATGANTRFRFKFEDAYGTRAAGNWTQTSHFSFGLSEEQGFDEEPLLGAGRDAQEPSEGAINVNGDNEVPIDQRMIGVWLKLVLGDAVNYSGGDAPQQGARGFIDFREQPQDGDSITLDGGTWTFVTAGPTGDQTQIGGSLEATLDQLAADLNAAAAPFSAASYSRLGDRLFIQHDTVGAAGNAFTLAVSTTARLRASAATLTGGGLYLHEFHSGGVTLPSLSIEQEHSDLEPGSARFEVFEGVMANSLTIGRARTGAARATLNLISQRQSSEVATAAGTPVVLPTNLFSNLQGVLLSGDRRIANITGAELSFNNNLDVVEALRDDGLIEGSDPGGTQLGLSLTSRYSINAPKQAADSKTPVDIRFGYYEASSGAELGFHLHRLRLPKPRKSVDGPGGIEVTYQGIGSTDPTLERSLTVRLYNDQIRY